MDNIHPDKPGIVQAELDFGWIIQNRQLGEAEFCQFLVNEISPELGRLVQRFAKSPADQMKWVDEILFVILLQRHDFKNNLSGKTWLYRIALQVCTKHAGSHFLTHANQVDRITRTIDLRLPEKAHFQTFFESLPKQERLYTILHKVQGLPEGDIATVLQLEPDQVQEGLEHVRQSLLAHQQTCPHCNHLPMTMPAMETALEQDLYAENALLDAAREDQAGWSRALLDRIHRSATRRLAKKWAARITKFGFVAVLFLAAQWGFSGKILFFDLSPTSAPVASELVGLKDVVLATQLTPAPTPTPNTVTQKQDAQQILNLALTSWARWGTIWADVQVTTYNLQNYSDGVVSVPQPVIRKQLWLSLPGFARVISGLQDGNPSLSYIVANGHMTGQDIANGKPLDQSSSFLIPDQVLSSLFSPIDMFHQGGKFSFIGVDQVGWRPTWVIDWHADGQDPVRYWIDQQYGVILRRVETQAGAFQPIVSDIMVTRIFFDASFPAAIFQSDVYQGDLFAYDFSGTPEIGNIKAALQTWSPSRLPSQRSPTPTIGENPFRAAYLNFVPLPADGVQKSQTTGIELYADQKDLGTLPMGGTVVLSCKRSPDGGTIAYDSPPQAGSEDTSLFVANLASIQSAQPVLPNGITAGDFTFSPDGHKLAFFGCDKASNYCGVYILDLATQKLTRLAAMVYADYLVWSEDGKSIALLSADDPNQKMSEYSTTNLIGKELMVLTHTWSYQIIRATDGALTDRQLFDWSSLGQSSNPAMQSWYAGIQAPAGVQGCVNPPVD